MMKRQKIIDITLFSIVVPISILLLAMSKDSRYAPHIIVFDGTASAAKTWYTLKSSGRIEKLEGDFYGHQVTINSNDKINGNTARGFVGDAKDGFVIYGNIEEISLDDPTAARVYIDGQPFHTIVLEGEAASNKKTEYTLRVTGHIKKYKGSINGRQVTLNPNDTVKISTNISTVQGLVGDANDGFYIFGNIEEISLDNPAAARIYVDGQPFHTLVLQGDSAPNKKSDYTLRVSGHIMQYEGIINGRKVTINPNDNLRGSTVSGLVGEANDGFYIYGDIEEISLDDPTAARVYLDGVLYGSEENRTSAQALTAVVPGRAEPVTSIYRDRKAGQVLRGHAVGWIQASSRCTATWIGPNTAVTAAHCGGSGKDVFIRMEWYPEGGETNNHALDNDRSGRKDYQCSRYLASAYVASNSDLAVWECGIGEDPAPGDRFGWVDYSVLVHDDVGDPVYSIWTNSVNNNSEWGIIRLYSEGKILKTNARNWSAPNCVTGSTRKLPYAHSTDLYSVGGASGSLQLSPRTHTAIIGPHSTGNNSGRQASSMAQILNQKYLPPGEKYLVQTNLVPQDPPQTPDQNGCVAYNNLQNPAETDENGNLVLDVHESVDNLVTQRPIYYFDFDSGWRRILWKPGPGYDTFITGSPTDYQAVLNGPSGSHDVSGYVQGLRHDGVDLKPNTRYDIRLLTQAAQRTAFKLRLVDDGNSCSPSESHTILPAGFAWTTHTLVTGNCSNYYLDLQLEPNRLVTIPELLVAERDAVWSFENWDEREPWLGANNSNGSHGHALIYENGESSSDDEIFAGQVWGTASARDLFLETLRLEAIPIHPETRYELTFSAKEVNNSDTAMIKVGVDGESPVLAETFRAGPQWEQHQYEFTTGKDDGHILQFAHQGSGQMSIDNVQLTVCGQVGDAANGQSQSCQ